MYIYQKLVENRRKFLLYLETRKKRKISLVYAKEKGFSIEVWLIYGLEWKLVSIRLQMEFQVDFDIALHKMKHDYLWHILGRLIFNIMVSKISTTRMFLAIQIDIENISKPLLKIKISKLKIWLGISKKWNGWY